MNFDGATMLGSGNWSVPNLASSATVEQGFSEGAPALAVGISLSPP